ncbi:MAG TPA: type II secretion system protein [Thermoanaerobaculia bacterium]|jgi:prepilin-type N-terminal cleavage/methylation domain-containing protein|nr:type II secretion system protein [Thermoanaerobaculia bacterium]
MRSQRGFSLVELLFALLVLTIVITTTLAVFVERTRRLRQASETILAYQVLANEAELQRRIPFAAVVPSATFNTDMGLLGAMQPVTTSIDVSSTQGGVKNVTMTIRWNRGQREAKLGIVRVDTGGGNLW